jgi:GWxTD domain-containing protein
MRARGLALVFLILAAAPAVAAPRRDESRPLPWRAAGRPGFTVDAAALPDTAGWQLEVYVRIPPEPLHYLMQGGERRARLRLTVRLSNQYGARLQETTQEIGLSAADSVSSFGHVVATRFPVKPGKHRLSVRLEDLLSRKRGLAYVGRKVAESAQVEEEFVVTGEERGLDVGDLEFLWSSAEAAVPSLFRHGSTQMLPNPERLFGLYAPSLQAYFAARGAPQDLRPWHWHARIYRGQQVVAEQESTLAGALDLRGMAVLDLSTLPAGGYDLEVKVWREGDEVALLRRGRFSVAWQVDSWRRSSTDVEDELHFLLSDEEEGTFSAMQPGEQERFLDEFWKRRDPTPDTAENEWRRMFAERVAYANEHFGYRGLEKGMFTDMGRVYVRYGPPSDIQKQVVPAGDKTLLQMVQELAATEDMPMGNVRVKGFGGDLRPFEVWIYEGVVPLPIEVDPERVIQARRRERLVFLFVDEQGYGRYVLRYSTE